MKCLLGSATGFVVLVGCGSVSETAWDLEVATVSCKTVRRCDPISFHRDFGSVAVCVDNTTVPPHDGCTFDRGAAADCLDAFQWSCRRIGREYDSWRDRCQAVWTCGGTPTADTGTTGVPPL